MGNSAIINLEGGQAHDLSRTSRENPVKCTTSPPVRQCSPCSCCSAATKKPFASSRSSVDNQLLTSSFRAPERWMMTEPSRARCRCVSCRHDARTCPRAVSCNATPFFQMLAPRVHFTSILSLWRVGGDRQGKQCCVMGAASVVCSQCQRLSCAGLAPCQVRIICISGEVQASIQNTLAF